MNGGGKVRSAGRLAVVQDDSVELGDNQIGSIAGLGAALLWTISSLFWSRVRLSAWALNYLKSIVGSVMLLVHLVGMAWLNGHPVFQANAFAWHMLFWGGLIGIAIGDYCYFRSLQIVGPRRCFLLTTTTPIFAIALMWIMSGQPIALVVLLGIVMTMTGVGLVVLDPRSGSEIPSVMPGRGWVGVVLGLGSALCQALGGMFSQQAMEHSDCSAGEAAFIRLLVAAVIMFVFAASRGVLSKVHWEFLNGGNWRFVLAGTALGTWLGIWLSQIAYQKTDLALASTLLTTSPLFAIPVLYLYIGQRTSVVALVGSLVAVLGVAIALNPETVQAWSSSVFSTSGN